MRAIGQRCVSWLNQERDAHHRPVRKPCHCCPPSATPSVSPQISPSQDRSCPSRAKLGDFSVRDQRPDGARRRVRELTISGELTDERLTTKVAASRRRDADRACEAETRRFSRGHAEDGCERRGGRGEGVSGRRRRRNRDAPVRGADGGDRTVVVRCIGRVGRPSPGLDRSPGRRCIHGIRGRCRRPGRRGRDSGRLSPRPPMRMRGVSSGSGHQTS